MEQILQWLPDLACIVVCLVGCICSGAKTGSIKKMLVSLCPSIEPLQALQDRVYVLETTVSELSALLKQLSDVVGLR